MFASASSASYKIAQQLAQEDADRVRRKKKLTVPRNSAVAVSAAVQASKAANAASAASAASTAPATRTPFRSALKSSLRSSASTPAAAPAQAQPRPSTPPPSAQPSSNRAAPEPPMPPMSTRPPRSPETPAATRTDSMRDLMMASLGNYDSKNAVTDMQSAPIDVLLSTAADIVADQIADSERLTKAKQRVDRMPHFELREITLGRVLGRGGFCMVREIEKIKMLDEHGNRIRPAGSKKSWRKGGSILGSISTRSSVFSKASKMLRFGRKPSLQPPRTRNFKRSDSISNGISLQGESIFENDLDDGFDIDNDDDGLPQSHTLLQSHSVKSAPAASFDLTLSKDFVARDSKRGKYVLKRVCLDLKHDDKVTFLKGTVDLAMEATFLAGLNNHPNIISLVGVSSPKDEDYFLVIEKLQETLAKRFKTWSNVDRVCKGITGAVIGSKKKSENLLRERLEVAYDIASGGAYLHRNNIIFRDLKPDNIGFDANNVVKIFDFGLAKELNEKEKLPNGLYRMTGMTGAMRYMAPEVGLSKPYTLSADVYSWAMIMWYILALEPPFGFYTQDMIVDRVFQRKTRPAIFKSWPVEISNLMERAWHNNINHRPPFTEIVIVLRQELHDGGGSTVAGSSIGGD